ncbi:MAG: aminotransferase class V-fold PLP-dependent enzyme [Nitrososphaerales archaeon]
MRIRDEFLITKNFVYLNNAAYTPMPLRSIEALRNFYYEYSLYGPDTGDYYEEIKNRAHEVRYDLGKLLDCDVNEIIYTESATQAINFIAMMLPLKKGDEIILRDSLHEHPSNFLPWLHLERIKGVRLRKLRIDKWGYPSLGDLERTIKDNTKLIVITHALYNLGSIMPVKEIGKIAKEKGILFFVDGSQSLGCLPLSVREIKCDFFAFTAAKWLCGPLGLGGFYCSKKVAEDLTPLVFGEESAKKYTASNFQYKDIPFKLQEGFRNWGSVIALKESLKLIGSLGIERIRKRNMMLANKLIEGLKGLKRIELYGPEEEDSRISIVAFNLKGYEPEVLIKHLIHKGVVLARRWLTKESMVRASPHFYNSEQEIEKLLKLLKALC